MDTVLKQTLKAKAHHLKPVVLLGAKGLTAAVVEETDLTLKTHELVKIKINGAEKEDRKQMATDLCEQLKAELVQLIGNTAIVYRKNRDKVSPKKKPVSAALSPTRQKRSSVPRRAVPLKGK